MTVLITGAATRLGREISESLKNKNELRLIDDGLLEEEDAREAVNGVSAIAHLSVTAPDHVAGEGDELDQRLIDHASRGTYNLMKAAVAAGVERVVYGSSLHVVENYPEDFVVTENWQPRPRAEAVSLSPLLGELTCREFTDVGSVAVICLRFASIVQEEEIRGQPFDPQWVDVRDAASAVQSALTMDIGDSSRHHRWWVFHICSENPEARYLVSHAKSGLGFAPQYNFDTTNPKESNV